ncbi:head-tail adaptor protein [Rhodobacteraceae bacterium KMM 6894]|nr:head-tail adaptor protein [Rhodobacteraceae bacterium KMM 6894]
MGRVNLNRQLVLEAPTRVADGAGGFDQGWAVLGTLWADISARTGREVMEGSVQMSSTSYRIMVRAAAYGAPSRPKPEQRFRDGARVFRIEAVADRDPTGRYLTCYATEEVAV